VGGADGRAAVQRAAKDRATTAAVRERLERVLAGG
jgi:hypothetical protein